MFNSDLTEKCVVYVSVKIKELLQPLIEVPVSKMQLSGWVNKFGDKVADDVSAAISYFTSHCNQSMFCISVY